jgi:hypothetical protein
VISGSAMAPSSRKTAGAARSFGRALQSMAPRIANLKPTSNRVADSRNKEYFK